MALLLKREPPLFQSRSFSFVSLFSFLETFLFYFRVNEIRILKTRSVAVLLIEGVLKWLVCSHSVSLSVVWF